MSDLLERAARAQLAVVQVEQKRARLLDERRAAIRAAKAAGHTYGEIGATIGLSPQRVQRAVAGNKPLKPRLKAPVYVEL